MGAQESDTNAITNTKQVEEGQTRMQHYRRFLPFRVHQVAFEDPTPEPLPQP
jgi:hypothetical protein